MVIERWATGSYTSQPDISCKSGLFPLLALWWGGRLRYDLWSAKSTRNSPEISPGIYGTWGIRQRWWGRWRWKWQGREVGHLLMPLYSKRELNIEMIYSYVERDQAWTLIDSRRFKKDWKEVRTMAKRGRTLREKADARQKTILEMAVQATYYAFSKLRILTHEYSFKQAQTLINRAVIVPLKTRTSLLDIWKSEKKEGDCARANCWKNDENIFHLREHSQQERQIIMPHSRLLPALFILVLCIISTRPKCSLKPDGAFHGPVES